MAGVALAGAGILPGVLESGNEGVALLTLAGRTDDPARARKGLEQLTLAEATLYSGGHIPWAETFARQISAAQALVDRLSGGPP